MRRQNVLRVRLLVGAVAVSGGRGLVDIWQI